MTGYISVQRSLIDENTIDSVKVLEKMAEKIFVFTELNLPCDYKDLDEGNKDA